MTTHRRRVLRALLLVAVLAIAALVSAEVLSRVRGAPSSEELVDQYVQGMRRGNVGAIAWLMPADREDRRAISDRMERYRGLPTGASLEVAHTQHSEAAYFKGAKISYRGQVIDEIGMQHYWNRPVGTRWRLFFPPGS